MLSTTLFNLAAELLSGSLIPARTEVCSEPYSKQVESYTRPLWERQGALIVAIHLPIKPQPQRIPSEMTIFYFQFPLKTALERAAHKSWVIPITRPSLHMSCDVQIVVQKPYMWCFVLFCFDKRWRNGEAFGSICSSTTHSVKADIHWEAPSSGLSFAAGFFVGKHYRWSNKKPLHKKVARGCSLVSNVTWTRNHSSVVVASRTTAASTSSSSVMTRLIIWVTWGTGIRTKALMILDNCCGTRHFAGAGRTGAFD